MPSHIVLNAPVRDPITSMTLREAVGWAITPQDRGEVADGVIISKRLPAMFARQGKRRQFTARANAREACRMQDCGLMLRSASHDVDGRVWETIFMDTAHVQPH